MNKLEFDKIPWGAYFWGLCEPKGYNSRIELYRKPVIYGEPTEFDDSLEQIGTEMDQSYKQVTLIEYISQPTRS